MKNKYLFLFFIFFPFSVNADILYVKKNRCITDDYFFQNSRFHYVYSSTGNAASTKTFKDSDLEYGYEFVDDQCQKIQVLKRTKMTYAQYKFMLALTGLLIGFVLFISVIYLFLKV